LPPVWVRFGPSASVSTRAVVYIVLGVLVAIVVLSELISWAQFADALCRWIRRERPSKEE